MAVGKIYPQEVKSNDPLFIQKFALIQSTNYLHDQTRQDKDRIKAEIFFALSILLAVITSYYVEHIRLWNIILLADIWAGILVYYGVGYYKVRKIFWRNRAEMKKSFKALNLEWKD